MRYRIRCSLAAWRGVAGVAPLVLAVLLGLGAPSSASADHRDTCRQAVETLLDDPRIVLVYEHTERSGGMETLYWSASDGTEGSCRVDSFGRVVGVDVDDFEVVGTGVPLKVGDTIRCESRGGLRNDCALPAGTAVRLVDKLSQGSCRLGSTWGYVEGERVWVDDGCRAFFEIIPGETGVRMSFAGTSAQASGMCQALAEDSGLIVRDVVGLRQVGSRWEVEMRVSTRSGASFVQQCTYDTRFDSADLH